MKHQQRLTSILIAAAFAAPVCAQEKLATLSVDPPIVHLRGPQAVYTLLVTGKSSDGRAIDLTNDAAYVSSDPAIAAVSPRGVVRGKKDGKAEITVTALGKTAPAKIEVQGAQEERVYHFENDIMPLFSRFGCNSAGCHGNAGGQNGFQASPSSVSIRRPITTPW